MKFGFYPKLAFDGIRKNKRLYLPYIFTCVGMVAMYYIIVFLQTCKAILSLRGGQTVAGTLEFGGWVVALFAGIFLFYTNSFLIRRRKKEFGLYNILGMDKWNIGRILLWESLIISAISLAIGLFCGIALSKLAELGLVNVMKAQVTYSLSVSVDAILMTLAVFGVIFVLLLLNSLRQIRFANAISLIRSENTGEKPPKGNWLIGLLGLALLVAAYAIAVTIKDPISALVLFFVAVVMVIVGTYLLMIAGSVLFCRILQKNKSYYYRPNHFVSVSSMVYRMKRNGAGLASICILATMVLVMISSTSCLYFGAESSLRNRYPKDLNFTFYLTETDEMEQESLDRWRNTVAEVTARYGAEPKELNDFRSAEISGLLEGDTVHTDVRYLNNFNLSSYSNVCTFYLIPLEDYNAMMGTSETLAPGEAMIYTYRISFKESTLSFENGERFAIKKHIDKFISNGDSSMQIIPTVMLIVPDLAQSVEGLSQLADYNGNRMIQFKWRYEFNTGLEPDQQVALCHELRDVFRELHVQGPLGPFTCESLEIERDDYYGTFGGFFYLGLILSIVFIFAAVLIIYYKQLSEGYEDQARFAIMQKVGMTKREIRKSINSQLLTVFFLPLVGAGAHLAFAFPMIRKLLLLFNLNNVALFAWTTVISFCVFALFYTLVYRITSNAYFRIVSGAKED